MNRFILQTEESHHEGSPEMCLESAHKWLKHLKGMSCRIGSLQRLWTHDYHYSGP